MALPAPAVGLVVQYGFVWAGPEQKNPPDAGKDRPCLIARLEAFADSALGGRVVQRVTYLPISHVAPRGAEQAVAIPARISAHLGLTAEISYLYVSYAVEDDWPFDLALVPGGAGRFDYGFVPPRFFEIVRERFAARIDGVYKR